jgi:hypothetical protein
VKGPVRGDRQVAEGASDEKAGDAITGTGTSSNEIPGANPFGTEWRARTMGLEPAAVTGTVGLHRN